MTIKIILAIALAWTSFLPFGQENSKQIEGSWVIEDAELAGKKLDALKGAKLTMAEGKYEFQNDKGDYKLSVAEKLNALDIIGKEGPNQGKTIPTIYQLDGDSLKICYDLTGKARPTEFKTEAGSRLLLVTYRRENAESQLIELERQLSDALIKQDVAALDRLWSNDLVFTFPNGKVSNKAERLASQKPSAAPAQFSNNNDEVKISLYGNTAVVTVLTTWKGKQAAQEFSDQYQTTHVWVKQQARWQLVAAHTSQVKK